jgi:putative chitobiose transport system substrate-binding protein
MKRFIALFLIFLSVLIFTACSIRKDATPKEITFWTLQMGDFSDFMYKVIREYESEHPNIQIKWIDVPFSEGEKRTLAAVMTDSPPDLINLNPDFSALLAQRGTLEEIAEESLENFNPEIVKALQYNGKTYSIPWYATSAITIYNKELFKQTGLLRTPKTYKELATISEKIKNTTGAYSYIPTITENDTMLKILNKYGISDFDNMDSDISISVFEMFKNLYQKELIPPETITLTHREALEQYMAGKTVFYQGGANFLNMIKENAPSIYENTDVLEQIKGPIGQNDFSVMNFVIPLRAKHKAEALDFCLFLTNEENQLELAKLTNIIATNENALSNPFYNDYSDLTSKARSISAKQINKITPALRQNRNQKEINLIINTAVQSALLNKGSIPNLLKQMKQDLINLN